jgi:hypothetical protein
MMWFGDPVIPGGLHQYAAPVDKPVLLDDEGFLLPVANHKWLTPPIPVVALLAGHVSLALLAAGGAGKTETVTALAEFETGARRINAAPLTRDGLERRINDACHDGAAVYLDGLDQAASVDPRLFQWLEDELTTTAARRVRWRLACRSAAWDAALARALHKLSPGSPSGSCSRWIGPPQAGLSSTPSPRPGSTRPSFCRLWPTPGWDGCRAASAS